MNVLRRPSKADFIADAQFHDYFLQANFWSGDQFSRSAIFNRCAAAHWCDAKGPQVCYENLREGRKEGRKNVGLRNLNPRSTLFLKITQ
jgi:hypothetical protein